MITKKLRIPLDLELKRILKSSRSSTKRTNPMIVMVLVGLVMVLYSGFFTMIPVTSNSSKDLVLTFGLVLSLLAFLTGISNGSKNLSSKDEFETLCPVFLEEGDTSMTKFIDIYLGSLFYVFVVFPIPIVWFGIIHGSLVFISNLLSVLVLPIFPIFLGVLLVTQISRTFCFYNTKTALQALGTVSFLAIYTLSMIQAGKYSDQFAGLWSCLAQGLRIYYLPSSFFDRAFNNQFFLGFLALLALTPFLLSFLGHSIIRNYIQNPYKNVGVKIQKKEKSVSLSSGSKLKSLYKKEIKHYFRRINYVSNTILSLTLIPGLGVVSFFIKLDRISGQVLSSLPGFGLVDIACYILTSTSVNAQITYCNSFLGGENFGALRAMPLSFKDLVLLRVLLGMTSFSGPIPFISLVFSYTGRVGVASGVFMILTGTLVNLFGNPVGTYFDLMTLDLAWKDGLEIIKQRFSAVLMSLVMVLSVFITWILTTLLNIKFVIPTSLIMCLFFIVSIAIVYLMLEETGDRLKDQ